MKRLFLSFLLLITCLLTTFGQHSKRNKGSKKSLTVQSVQQKQTKNGTKTAVAAVKDTKNQPVKGNGKADKNQPVTNRKGHSATATKAPQQTNDTHQQVNKKGQAVYGKVNGKNVRGGKHGAKAPRYVTTEEIKGLQRQNQQIQKEISEHEEEMKVKQKDVETRLQKIVRLDTEIGQHQRTIDTIATDIKGLDNNIGILKSQLVSLEAQLGERRSRFIRSMRYMARHRSIQDKLMFVFSAKSLTQMYRRLRFVREYAAYQRAQGEQLQAKQRQVDEKHNQLQQVRGHKSNLLYKDRIVHAQMEHKRVEQQNVVATLQQDQKVLQGVIAQRRQQQQALNAQIDRLIQIEIQKARARAIAEARAQAAARAAAARAAAEKTRQEAAQKERAAARERAIRKAEQQEAAAKDAMAKAEAKANAAQERADQVAREAESNRIAAERKAAADRERAARETAAAQASSANDDMLTSADRALTGSFANNRGRLPMPMSGHIVSHFGQYNVAGMSNVRLSNDGINIKGAPGSAVRSVFMGEVSGVFMAGGVSVVMIRHGIYITVYANLGSVSVGRGQKVGTGQTIGTVGKGGILQFQLRKETAKLNPEQWLR